MISFTNDEATRANAMRTAAFFTTMHLYDGHHETEPVAPLKKMAKGRACKSKLKSDRPASL